MIAKWRSTCTVNKDKMIRWRFVLCLRAIWRIPGRPYFSDLSISGKEALDEVKRFRNEFNTEHMKVHTLKIFMDGKDADFLVFDKDLLTAEHEGVSYNKPDEVYFGGKKVSWII